VAPRELFTSRPSSERILGLDMAELLEAKIVELQNGWPNG